MTSVDGEHRMTRDLSISKAQHHVAILRRLRNSLISPLCRTPYEIVVKIFSFVPDPNDEEESISLLIAKTGPICHRIWLILQDTPKFWGHVDFSHSDSVTYLFRCRGRPSNLWVRYGPSDARNAWITSVLYKWFSIAPPSVESLEEFRFYGKPSDFDLYRWIFAHHLPRLHTLTLASGRTSYSWVPEDIETWTVSARFSVGLRSLTLKQVLIPWETILTSHLVQLDLDYSQTPEGVPILMSTFLELLSLCTRLEIFRLFCAGPEAPDEALAYVPSANPLYLSNLRVFDIADNAPNIAYMLNNLKLPDTAHVHIEPSLDWPQQLVSFTLPRATRISPIEGLIRWYAGQESTLSMGNTEFTYHMDAEDEDFMAVYRSTFDSPFLEFAGHSTSALTALELDFDLDFEPDQVVWSTVLAALPALRRLSCTSRGAISRHFAPKFFTEFGKGSQGQIHCPELEELDLSGFDLCDTKLMFWIVFALGQRFQAGFPVQRFVQNKSFDVLSLDTLQRRVADLGWSKAFDIEVPVW